MSDNYPRRTLEAIAAYLAGSLTVGVIATAVFTTLTATTGNFTTINSTLTSSTQIVVGQGTSVDKILSTSYTANVDAIPALSGTSSNHTLTGAATGDDCAVTAISGDFISTTSTASLNCRVVSANNVSVFYRNLVATSTFDGGTSDFRISTQSYQ